MKLGETLFGFSLKEYLSRMKFQSFCKRLFLGGFILTMLCSMPAVFQQMIIPTLYSNQIYIGKLSITAIHKRNFIRVLVTL